MVAIQRFFASLRMTKLLRRTQRGILAPRLDLKPTSQVELWVTMSRRLIAGVFLSVMALYCSVTPANGRARREKPKPAVARAGEIQNQAVPNQAGPQQTALSHPPPAAAPIALPPPSTSAPAVAPCDEACQQGRQSLAVQRRLAWLLGGLLLVGLIQVATMLVQALLLRMTREEVHGQAGWMETQARTMKEQLSVLKGCVSAAQTTADAAVKQISHAVASERPWMDVQMAQKELAYSHLKFVAKNRGCSPAKITMYTVEKVLVSTEEAHDGPKFGSNGRVDEVQWRLAGDDFVVGEFQLPPDLSTEVRQPGVSVLYQGFVRYNDTVTEDQHETRFCYEAFAQDDGPVRFRMFPASGYNVMM
jgi:hypothetical protein